MQHSAAASHTGIVKIRWRSTVDKWKGHAPSDEAWVACEDPRVFGEFVPGMDVVMSDDVSAESTGRRRFEIEPLNQEMRGRHEHVRRCPYRLAALEARLVWLWFWVLFCWIERHLGRARVQPFCISCDAKALSDS
jgi:hypothetical protein